MHPDVRKLLEVQKVDREIARLRKDLDSLPGERARREKSLGALRAQQTGATTAFREAEVSARSNEISIKQGDDEIKKLEARLNTVKNNAEYQATLLQMESVRRERGRLEEDGLAQIDQIEGLRGAALELAELLKDEEAVFAEFQVKADVLERERSAEVSGVAVGRAALLAEIPPELLHKYDRLFDARGGLAVCSVEGQTCTGCYSSIPPNLQVKLQSGSAVVQCSSCQRILYLPE